MASLGTDDRRFIYSVLRQLDMESGWTVDEPDGVGFVAADLGTWLSVDHRAGARLRVETRLAVGVASTPAALAYIGQMNHFADVGRMVLDEATATVAVTADIPLYAADGAAAEVAAFVVACVVATAEAAAYYDRPRRQLGGEKAIAVIRRDRRRRKPHPVVSFVTTSVMPRGRQPEPVAQAFSAVQDEMVATLPGWSIEHGVSESVAVSSDETMLVVRAASHRALGHGLMLVAGDPRRWEGPDVLGFLARCNRQLQRRGGLGVWTSYKGLPQRRVFLPAAMLQLMATQAPASAVILDTLHDLERDSQPDSSEPSGQSVLVRPVWPGDDRGAVIARRQPTNEGDNVEGAFVHIDHLQRPAYTGKAAFEQWYANLHSSDLANRGVKRFTDWWRREDDARTRRLATKIPPPGST